MNEKTLRALVREEVEAVLTEQTRIDSHPKFRRLVENKLGRQFQESDENWSLTFESWNAALSEAGGVDIDQETLDYYLNEAVEKILAL